MKNKELSFLYFILAVAVVGLACNLPTSLLDMEGEGVQGVEDRIQATFQARTQQAQGTQPGEKLEPTATPPTGRSSTQKLSSGATFQSVNGVTVGASHGALKHAVDITITRLDVGTSLPEVQVKKVGKFYHLQADRRVTVDQGSPLFVAFSIPEGQSLQHLAVAMLGNAEEFAVDAPGIENMEQSFGDAWLYRTASIDPEDRLVVITLFSLPEEGRTFAVVEDDAFAPSFPSQSFAQVLAKPAQNKKGPFFKAKCDPVAFKKVSWKCTERDSKAASTLLENAYRKYDNLGFKEPALYYNVKNVSSLPFDVPNVDTGARQYIITLVSCSFMKGIYGKQGGVYFHSKGPLGLQVCYNGRNVKWRGGQATDAKTIEDRIFHEYFHALQNAYLDGFFKNKDQSIWYVEGMAEASVHSESAMKRRRRNRHLVDIPLNGKKQAYRTQDFWVAVGNRLHRGVTYLIPVLFEGKNLEDVDQALKNSFGNTFPDGLSDAYWAWVKPHTFEGTNGGECALDTRVVKASNNEHGFLSSNITGPKNVKVDPLQSKIYRFNMFPLASSPAVKYQFTLRARPNDVEADSKFYFQTEENSTRCKSRSDKSKVFAVELPAGAEYLDHHALLANGNHSRPATFTLSITPHKYQVSILKPADTASVIQGEDITLAAAYKEDGTRQNTQHIQWTEGGPAGGGGSTLGQGETIEIGSGKLGGSGTHDIYATFTGNPPRERIYDHVTVNVSAPDAPSVQITQPKDGASMRAKGNGGIYDYDSRNRLIFTAKGKAKNGQGDALKGSSLQWATRCTSGCGGSNAWGSAGTGATQQFKLRDEQCGPTEYQLRLQATDSFGTTAQHIITILINVTGC